MLLYIHVPYCDSKCHYCNFNSYTSLHQTKERYMQALLVQMRYELQRFSVQPKQITTVFFGGGTPSTLPSTAYKELFALLYPYFTDDAEITMEANPNSADIKWLCGIGELGVNRISFGVQSFNDEKLKQLGRAHTRDQARNGIIEAKNIGFEHINIDIIYNVQGDNKTLLQSDLNEAFELPIDHISAYELTIEDGTRFTSNDRQHNDNLAFFVAQTIRDNGFTQYEISNFGRYKCQHNLGYWRLENYIGVGAGAVGFLNDSRLYPPKDIEAYIQNPLAIFKENLTDEDIIFEKIFLGLRSEIGVAKSLLDASQLQKALMLLEEKKLREESGIFYNPNYFISDEIALYLTS